MPHDFENRRRDQRSSLIFRDPQLTVAGKTRHCIAADLCKPPRIWAMPQVPRLCFINNCIETVEAQISYEACSCARLFENLHMGMNDLKDSQVAEW